MLSGSLLGIPIQAFADTVICFLGSGNPLMMTGAGKFFINTPLRCAVPSAAAAAKVCICLRPARLVRFAHLQRADRGHHDDSGQRRRIPASYSAAIEPSVNGRGAGAAGDGATAFVIAQFLNGATRGALAATFRQRFSHLACHAGYSYAARHGLQIRAPSRDLGYDQ